MASLGFQKIHLASIVQHPESHRPRFPEEQEIIDHSTFIVEKGALLNKFSVFQYPQPDGTMLHHVGDGAGRLESLKLANIITKGRFDIIDVEVFEPITVQ
jgi:hypothetical protein